MRFTLTDEKHPEYNAFRIMSQEDNQNHGIKVGDLGGFLETKDNLDSESSAWVFDDSVVLGKSSVTGNAIVKNTSVLKNITIGFDSIISNVSIQDFTFDDTVKIYTDTKNSIVIACKQLEFGVLTAKRYNQNGPIYVGYGTIFETINVFEKIAKSGYLPDSELCVKLTKFIKESLIDELSS